jgi:hypothetical protein
MDAFECEHAGDSAALKFLADMRREIEVFHSHGDA